MNPRSAMAMALMVATAGAGQGLAELLESHGHSVVGRRSAKLPKAKLPNPERQAAAEAKRQRRAARNRAVRS